MFNSIVLILLFHVAKSQISAQTCVQSSDPLIRCTIQGLMRGSRVDFVVNSSSSASFEPHSVYAFLGIPYAKVPDGENRFRKPTPKRAWTRGTIYNATTLPNSCYQMIIDYFNSTGEKIWAPFTPLSEDCLYLNVWTPITARQQQQPLAVMVWIYGGGFTSGSVSLKSSLF